MAKIAWIGDAGRPTGFSRVTHEIGERLVEKYGHDVSVLAVGWDGADPFQTRLKLHRAEAGPAQSYLGFDRVVPFLLKTQPDVVVTIEDPAILLRRLNGNNYDPQKLLKRFRPILSYLPVDGYNHPASFAELNDLVTVVAMSEFGQAAFPGSRLAYHGVDPAVFHEPTPENPIQTSAGPVTSKAECRETYEIPKDAFVIGRVDTNSGRKDWGSTWRVVDGYLQQATPEERDRTYAFWHTKRTNPGHGIDLEAVISRGKGHGGHYMITGRNDWPLGDVVAAINTFDVLLTTSRGEGFGLGITEAMACGVPVIATDCSAITEVVGPGGVLVPGKAFMTNPYGVDLVLADVEAMSQVLASFAADPDLRADLGRAAMEHVLANFNWDVTGDLFHGFIEEIVGNAVRHELGAATSSP